jgi:DNA polymerase-3 subunit epsilon
VDFEGTTPTGCPAEPIEVGAVILRPSPAGLTAIGQFEALMRPPAHAPLTVFDTRQTGITAPMLARRPAADVVLAGLDALLTSPPYVTVAHHAPTEAGILRRYAHACPTLAAAPMIDTIRLARACHPGLTSYALDALLTHLDIPIPAGRHRALTDASITARLLERLLAHGSTLHRWSQLAQLRQLAGLPPPADRTEQTALF